MHDILFLLLFLFRGIPCSCLVSIVPGDIILRSFFHEGISSLSFNSYDNSVYMGTKRGRLKKLIGVKQDNNQLLKDIEQIPLDIDSNHETLKPYPIYSLITCHRGKNMFCGGGDRYITIWSIHLDRWSISQRLGPHTGWVKDLAFYKEQYLFSIGCNCIEIWDKRNQYRHFKKIEVQSCSSFGATLSSDLLCLGVYGHFLFAGGVDGRIHKWDIESEFKYHEAVSVHDGRINKMLLMNQMKILVSVGNDGYVRCRDLSKEATHDPILTSWRFESDSTEVDEETVRITSLCSIHENESQADIVIGTACGMIRILSIGRESVGNSISLQRIDYRACLENRSTITSLQFYPKDTSSNTGHDIILIGHSNGAALCNLNFSRIS